MALKPFKELVAIDLTEHISKKPTFKKQGDRFVETGSLDYLSWADCLFLLYENGAEKVLFNNIRSAADHPLFMYGEIAPFVRVFVEIDGDRRELDYPLIDGSNDIRPDKITQSDIHNATQRAFVKCVAINWGLGLPLWQKEEKVKPEKSPFDDPDAHNLWEIKKRMEVLITDIMKQKGWDQRELCQAIGMKETIFTSTMTAAFNNIGLLEQRLREIK
jgi:hypothetical protein